MGMTSISLLCEPDRKASLGSLLDAHRFVCLPFSVAPVHLAVAMPPVHALGGRGWRLVLRREPTRMSDAVRGRCQCQCDGHHHLGWRNPSHTPPPRFPSPFNPFYISRNRLACNRRRPVTLRCHGRQYRRGSTTTNRRLPRLWHGRPPCCLLALPCQVPPPVLLAAPVAAAQGRGSVAVRRVQHGRACRPSECRARRCAKGEAAASQWRGGRPWTSTRAQRRRRRRRGG